MKLLPILGCLLFLCSGAIAQNAATPKSKGKKISIIINDSTVIDDQTVDELRNIFSELLTRTTAVIEELDIENKVMAIEKDLKEAVEMIADDELMQKLEELEKSIDQMQYLPNLNKDLSTPQKDSEPRRI